VIWPVASLPTRPMQVRPPYKLNLQLCVSTSGCADNSAHPWELIVFKRSLPVPCL